MVKEKELASKFIQKIETLLNEEDVKTVFIAYLDYIDENGLNKAFFLRCLSDHFACVSESQTPEQTLKNTMAAMALLKGEQRK